MIPAFLRLAWLAFLLVTFCASAPAGEPADRPPAPDYDPALAAELGADAFGMRSYVLALLLTGPSDAGITGEAERAALFQGHFANMAKLEAEGKLVLAGPLDGGEGRRGLFILNTADPEEAAGWVASDPAVEAGIFTVSYSRYYGPAGLMRVNRIQEAIRTRTPGR